MSATATPVKKTTRKRNSKIEKYILPILAQNPNSTQHEVEAVASEMVGSPVKVEALYFVQAKNDGLIKVAATRKNPNALAKTGAEFGRGRPANEWVLTKKAKDRLRRAQKSAS